MGGYTREPEQASRHRSNCWFGRPFMVFACFLAFTIQLAAQGATDANELFRQATEAMKEGRFEDAASSFAAVVRNAPEFAEAHLNLGLVLEEQGKNEAS